QGMPQVEAGKLRALGVTGTKTIAAAKDVPTMSSAGAPGYDVTTWFALVGPAGLPAPVVDRLFTETKKIAREAQFQTPLRNAGLEPILNTPAEFKAALAVETKKWADVVKAAGIKAE